ncbi:MAG: acyl-CoA dehydrogenase family protein [Pseudomonadota bacterium]|nr:acyl-CoA dehydrogenase family protein [Pseudomonadota bacterium]
MNPFTQDGPKLGNQFSDDLAMQNYLKRVLSEKMYKEIEPGLTHLGARAANEILTLGYAAEAYPPKHIPFDPWGKRIDRIEVSQAWRELERISAEEKLIATAYERRHGDLSRVHQFAKIYLYSPSSAIATCPLAMTDGAARALELYGSAELKARAFSKLTSGNPDTFWSSGQWMTEKTGGSDVSLTATVAKKVDGKFTLYGDKWFTSATTSQMAITLARIEGAPPGSKGLSMFYLELRDEKGNLNNIRVHRLKDKLGTRAVPTAELTLEGTAATLIGTEGDGVKKISSLFSITRVWNSCCAASFMRRGMFLARDYAHKRVAFGKKLIDHPLHQNTLAELEAQSQGAFHITFRVAELLGKDELNTATENDRVLLRVLNPIVKLYTAKKAIAHASEVLESFGGAGYCEDTGLPRLLRDAQVLSIWEGTTNVLSLDMVRAHAKERGLDILAKEIQNQLEKISESSLPALGGIAESIKSSLDTAVAMLHKIEKSGSDALEQSARELAMGFGDLYAATLLLSQADWELKSFGKSLAHLCAERLIRAPKQPPVSLLSDRQLASLIQL